MNEKTSQSISSSGPITAHHSTIVLGTLEGNINTTRRRISDESLTRVESPVPNFCGRKSELAEIAEAFQKNRIVVITGFVKVGKTELARKYCDGEDSYYHIIWLDSATPDVLQKSLDALSKKCGVNSSNRGALYELITKKKSLLVFDDAEDWVVDFLPGKTLKGSVASHILITSASKFQRSHIVFEKLRLQVTVLELKGFDPVDAVEFLQKSLELEELSSEDAALLAEKLYYQPHFLCSACKVIIGKNSERSTARSANRFKVKDFLENIITQVLNQSDLIESVLRRIRLSQHYEDALAVLNALSYLNKRAIPESLIHRNLPQFQSCRENLEKYFLVAIEDTTVSINPPVQFLNKGKLSAEKVEDILKFWLSSIGEDGSGSSALDAVVKWGSLELVEYIIAGKHAVPTVDTVCLAAEVDNIDVLKYLMGLLELAPLLNCYAGFLLLHHATANGSIETVKYLIETEHVDPSSTSNDLLKMTDDHYAARNGHIEIVKYLVGEGMVDPTAEDGGGKNAVHIAAMHGHIDIVKFLVGGKLVDPTTRDNSYENAVHKAAMKGHIDIVKYLVGEGMVDPTAEEEGGMDAVHIAAMHGHIDVVKYLVGDKLVDTTTESISDMNAVHYAAEYGHIDIVKFLVGGKLVDPTTKDKSDENAFHIAAMKGHIDIVKFLVGERMVDPTAKKRGGTNAVHLATMHGHIDVVKYLVGDKLVDPTTKSNSDMNAVHYAAMKGHIDIVKYLVGERMVDPTTKNDDGKNAVHIAAMHGHIDIVKFLVGGKLVDPTTKDNSYENAVHYAAMKGHIDIVKYLVGEMMVDPTAKNEGGRNAVHIAAMHGHIDVVKYLVGDKLVDPTTKSNSDKNAVHYAAMGGYIDIVKYLVGEGMVDPTTKNEGGWNAVHIAAMHGHIDIVKYLVGDKQVDPTTKDNSDMNAVHYAARHACSLEIVQYLVGEKLVDPVAKNKNGMNALHYAARGGNIDIVKYLVEVKLVDPSTTAGDGKTVVHLAAIRGNFDIVKYVGEKWVDLTVKDEDGKSAADYAELHANNHGMVKYLLGRKRTS